MTTDEDRIDELTRAVRRLEKKLGERPKAPKTHPHTIAVSCLVITLFVLIVLGYAFVVLYGSEP